MRLPDALRRAMRTFLQSFVGILSLLLIPFLTNMVRAISNSESYEIDFRVIQGIIVAAFAAGLISLITWAQNALEDKGTIPSVLKAKASSGAEPVTVDPAV